MLIASGTHSGRKLLILGLSRGNLDRLQQGQPIDRDLGPQGFPFRLMIHFGETEKAIADQLEAGFHAEPQPNEELLDAIEELGLGATGEYPHGKAFADDEGQLRAALAVKDDKLVMMFGKNIAWLAMTAAEARTFALSLQAKADELDPPKPATGN